MSLIVLIVWFLAVARVTRLINADTILDPPRLWLARRAVTARDAASEAKQLGQVEEYAALDPIARRWEKALGFVQCPWCVGMWLALLSAWAPMALLSWFGRGSWWLDVVVYLGLALAASHLVGVCARFADTDEIAFEDDDAS